MRTKSKLFSPEMEKTAFFAGSFLFFAFVMCSQLFIEHSFGTSIFIGALSKGIPPSPSSPCHTATPPGITYGARVCNTGI